MEPTAGKGRDEWVIDRTNQWITDAPYADFAQLFARAAPPSEADRYGGITCFIVEANGGELGSHNNGPGQVGWEADLRFGAFPSPTTACSARSTALSTTR